MDEPTGKPLSHLNRVFRALAVVGSAALILGLVIQYLQYSFLVSRGSPNFDPYTPIVLGQMLLIVGQVALTGAVIALVLLAVGKDRAAEPSQVEALPDRDLME